MNAEIISEEANKTTFKYEPYKKSGIAFFFAQATYSTGFTICSKIIAKRFEENEKKHNKRVRAELKDKIGQTYRYHHSTGKINDIELEALEDLIEEYEAADGENSFVHSLVQKEMYTWEKVELN